MMSECDRCDQCDAVFTLIQDRIDALELRFSSIDHLIAASNSAESLFASKVHDLKSIDKKRDDVIDALCQKVELLNKRVMDLMIDKL